MPVYPSINSSWYCFPYILANNAIIMFQSSLRLVSLKTDPDGFIYGGTEWLLSLLIGGFIYYDILIDGPISVPNVICLKTEGNI